MTQCRLIALTGGIATGKTTVSNIIGERYRLIDADKIAKDIVKKDMKGYNKIVEYFTEDILLSNGELDRKKLARKIFNSEKDRERLNKILHPLIFDEIEEKIDLYRQENYLFLDIPLLFEEEEEFKKRGIDFYEIWLVYLDRKIQVERLMERDGIDRDYAGKKIDAQLSLDYKKSRADRIIYNNGTRDELLKNLENLLDNLN